jgi:hypothetical protein
MTTEIILNIPPTPSSVESEYKNARIVADEPNNQEQKKIRQEIEEVQDEENLSVWEDIVGGVKEAPWQVLGGSGDFGNELAQFLGYNKFSEYIKENVPDFEESEFLGGFVSENEEDNLLPSVENPETTTGSFIRGTSQFLTGFIPMFGQIGKGTEALNIIKESPKLKATVDSFIAGFGTDVSGFEPNDPTLGNKVSDLLKSNPQMKEVVDTFLATDPNDSEGINRLRRGLEGILLGATAEKALSLGKKGVDELVDILTEFNKNLGQRGSIDFSDGPLETGGLKIKADNTKRLEKNSKRFSDLIALTEQRINVLNARLGVESEAQITENSLNKIQKELNNLNQQLNFLKEDKTNVDNALHVLNSGGTFDADEIIKFKSIETLKKTKDRSNIKDEGFIVKPSGDALKSLEERISKGEIAEAVEGIDFNFERIESSDDIRAIINTFSEELEGQVSKIKGGNFESIRTHQQVQDIADILGSSVDDINNAFKGTRNLDSKVLAARRILIASTDKVVKLAEAAQRGGVDEVIALNKHLKIHAALQLELKGIQTEIARALNAMKITALADEARFAQVDSLVLSMGGLDVNQKLAQRIVALAGKDNGMTKVNAMVKKDGYRRTRDAILEMFINGLLSNPKTQVTNMLGNGISMTLSLMERQLAGKMTSKVKGKGADTKGMVEPGEALQMLNGMMRAIPESYQMFKKALREDDPQFDKKFVKKDFYKPHERAISAEALGVSGPLAGAVDWLGTVTNMPGRMLMSMDDAMKFMNYRGELHAQAFRKATQLAPNNPEQFNKIYNDILENTPEDIQIRSTDLARTNTFQNQFDRDSFSGKFSALLEDPGVAGTILKIFVPFFTTPANLIRYAGQRTPLVAKRLKSIKADLNSTDPATRQLAEAKMKAGQFLYMTGTSLAMSGLVTGAMPDDPNLKRRLLETGWKPYSFFNPITNEYVPYNRFDPIGLIFGISADLVFASRTFGGVLGEVIDETGNLTTQDKELQGRMMEAVGNGIMAIWNNLEERNYIHGVANAVDMFTGDRIAGQRAFGELSSAVPPISFYSSFRRSVSKVVDPVIRNKEDESAILEIYNALISGIPGKSSSINPKRNILGEPQFYPGDHESFFWKSFNNIFNPFTPSQATKSPLLRKMVELQVNISGSEGIDKIEGVELNNDEIDYFARAWGELNKELDEEIKTNTGEVDFITDPGGIQKAYIAAQLEKNKKEAMKNTVDAFSRIEDEIETLKEKQEENLEKDIPVDQNFLLGLKNK